MFKKLGLTILCIVFLCSCTPIISMKSDDILSYKEDLISSKKVLHNLEVELIRPNLYWKLYVNKDSEDSDIAELFNSVLDFMKLDDRHKEWRKNHYFIETNIIFYDINNNEIIREYKGSYYKNGTTIYQDDKKNEIDDYTTWHVNDYETDESRIYNYSK
ncbi:hypothetical protein EDC18_103335 [Natranaerovirga pectinivora]|uniref:Lipoprotein n=1 Tax=Natranaerovirga pectinivora TaxID=682400 RepID=A0A4R3MS45_9FIRM|nr:hypothetical protein [Natranaerovirga pectinivora]TCT15627.1 hypothetical protein EDC18_103335 [Natranaerovirga pectinivora]